MLDLFGPGNIRDVNQPIDALIEPDEDAEVRDVPDRSTDLRPHRVLFFDEGPGVLLDPVSYTHLTLPTQA